VRREIEGRRESVDAALDLKAILALDDEIQAAIVRYNDALKQARSLGYELEK
jgi:hypothetical protein